MTAKQRYRRKLEELTDDMGYYFDEFQDLLDRVGAFFGVDIQPETDLDEKLNMAAEYLAAKREGEGGGNPGNHPRGDREGYRELQAAGSLPHEGGRRMGGLRQHERGRVDGGLQDERGGRGMAYRFVLRWGEAVKVRAYPVHVGEGVAEAASLASSYFYGHGMGALVLMLKNTPRALKERARAYLEKGE